MRIQALAVSLVSSNLQFEPLRDEISVGVCVCVPSNAHVSSINLCVSDPIILNGDFYTGDYTRKFIITMCSHEME